MFPVSSARDSRTATLQRHGLGVSCTPVKPDGYCCRKSARTGKGRPLADDEQPEGQEEPSTTPWGMPRPDGTRRHGEVRYQEPGSTTPREPTLAEQRARERAEQRREEAAAAELAAAERKTAVRRRVMIGGGVTVGVVAMVAAFYSASAYSEQRDAMTATCTGDQGGQTIAEQDQFCDQNYVTSHGGHMGNGVYFMPIFLPGGGIGGWNQYRYSYSPSGSPIPTPGQTVSHPDFSQPSTGTKVSTRSGSVIQRGGFGIGSRSGSGS
jgi:hypothetical protein